MALLPLEKMDRMVERLAEVETRMAEGPDAQTYVALASEHAELMPVVQAIREYREATGEREGAAEMLADPDLDAEMREMAKAEADELDGRIAGLEERMQLMLLPKDEADDRSAIIEIRGAAGGSEAALFAGDLFRMYERYATERKWSVEITSESEGEMGGYKEVVATISGRGVFSRLKFESGAHRVQRVPETESQGRIHTSTATVAVLPEAEEVDVEIRNEDIRIDTMRASGAGGQHVNTTDSAVRITHIPTGIMVVSAEKSQHQNRVIAMRELRTRLYDMQRQKADAERADARKSQVGTGDRSERIRTYNFPQGRVTDHRIGLTLYKLDKMLMGELDEMIDALVTEDQAARLAALGEEAASADARS